MLTDVRSSLLRNGILLIVALLVLPAFSGCGTKPGVIFPPLADAPRWPAPPDTERIIYVGKLETSADLKPGVSGWDAFGQALFGKSDQHSMLSPMAVCTDNAHRIFVADSNAQRVHVFDLQTRKYATWAPAKGQPPLNQPVGIAWDPGASGRPARLLVSDSVGGAIALFDTAGRFTGLLGTGALQRPVGIAVEQSSGRIFVADSRAHQIFVFSSDGQVIRRIGSRGAALGEFNFPTNIALDSQGRLYVSDSLNFRVQLFDREFKPLRQIGRKGDLPGYFAQPKGIAIDSEDHLYVLDGQFENIQIFDADGHVLMDFGQEGYGPGQFWLPAGLCIDRQDRIWVADSYNRRVQVFDFRKLPAEKLP